MITRFEADFGGHLDFLDGGGATGALIRGFDWGATPLGIPSEWPQSLRSALSICLQSSFPTAIYWGPDLRLLYNDAWAPIPAERHPWALGRPGSEVWADIWDVVGPQLNRVVETGEGFSTYDQLLPIVRAGIPHETYWNYSFTPIRGERGHVVGVFNQGHETTERVMGERRDRLLLGLTDHLRSLTDPTEMIQAAESAVGQFLGANRVGYGEVDQTARYFTTERNWTDGSVPSREGTHDLAAFGSDVLAALRAGIPLLITDAAKDPRTSAPASLAAFDAIDTRAVITASLVKGGRLRAALYVHAQSPRAWTDRDAALVVEVADRIWAAVERARAEERLRQSESRFRALVTAGSYSVFRMSPDWRRMRRLEEADDLAPDAGPAGDWLEAAVLPEDRAPVTAVIGQAVATRSVFELEHRVRRPDGTTGWTHSRAVPILGPDGSIVEWFGMATDVTARKSAEERLRVSEGRLRFMNSLDEALRASHDAPAAMKAASELLAERLGASRCAYAAVDDDNDRFTIHDGYTAPGIPASAGTYRLDLFGSRAAADMRQGAILVIRDVAAELAPGEGREMFQALGIEAIVSCPLVREDRLVAMMAVHQDRPRDWHDEEVSLVEAVVERCWSHVERVGAEARLRESEERYRTLFEAIDAGFCIVEVLLADGNPVDYQTLDVNPAFERQTGLRDPADRRIRDRVPDHERHWFELFGRVAMTGESVRFENEAAGLGRWFDVHAFRVGAPEQRRVAILFNDISESRRAERAIRELNETLETRVAERTAELMRAEEALRQAQKMEAVGQLTGGVAHDFNNLLTIIKSSVDFLRRPGLPEERHRRYVDAINETVDRASKLTGQLLAFARRQALKPEVFDVSDRLRAVTDMLRTIVGARIEIVTRITVEPCFVEADVSQFETAIINMAVNARDAMDGEGTLTVSVHASEGPPAGLSDAAGPYVALTIADTGHGIPPDRLSQVFEPFYTTKEVGKGTGLGLSQVYGFARQSRGDVTVESEIGRGTRFTLYLPRAAGVRDDGAPQAFPRDHVPDGHGLGRRILLVEDNLDVGRFSTQILQDLGYETVWARNADEALRILDRGEAFDLVFSDVVMPGMSGIELGREIRSRYPDLPVVLTSGYSQVLAEEGRHGFELIQKPYAAEDLSRVLRRVGGPVGD